MKNEPGAVANAMQEARECAKGDPRGIMLTTAQGVLAAGQHEASIALSTLKHLVDGMAHLPGQRSVILVSPGFYAPGFESDLGNIIDRAVRSQVAINALDARGLYVILPFGDASEHSQNIPDLPTGSKATYQYAAAKADADVMNDLTDGTGGTFFRQNNDFDEGFRRVAETPAYTYTLGFVPQDLKPDGKFHSLSVKLKDSGRFSIQARRGYFAPKKLEDAAEQAKEDLQEAIFSQEQMHDLPLDLHMQFFKSSDDQAKLTVLAHLDARHIHFTKNAGRNDQELTIVSAVFNSNGSFLEGNQKVVTLHLKDETLQAELTNGITTKANFEVKPGSYLVRVVVRDSQGQLSAQNGAIDIP
jgi:hypothetical protein